MSKYKPTKDELDKAVELYIEQLKNAAKGYTMFQKGVHIKEGGEIVFKSPDQLIQDCMELVSNCFIERLVFDQDTQILKPFEGEEANFLPLAAYEAVYLVNTNLELNKVDI